MLSYRWVLVMLMFAISALNYADRTVLTAVFPLLKTELGMSDIGLAAVGTIFLWSYGLASPFAGVVGDRHSRRSVIIWCLVAWSLVMIAMSFATNATHLLVMRLLLGLSEALFFPAATGLVSEYHGTKTRAFAIATQSAGISAGAVLGGTLGGYLGEIYGWRMPVSLLGGAGLLLAGLSAVVIRKEAAYSPAEPASAQFAAAEASSYWQAVMRVLSVPVCQIIIAQGMLLAIGTWIFMNWLPMYFSQVFKLSLGSAGFAGTAALNVSAVVGILIGGWISDRAAARGTQYRLLVQGLLYFASVPFLMLFMGSSQLNFVTFSIFAFTVVRSLGQAAEVPVVYDHLPSGSWSTAMGVLNAAYCACGGLAILASGYLKATFGLKLIFFSSSLLVVMAGALMLIGYRISSRINRPLTAENDKREPERKNLERTNQPYGHED